MKPLAIDLYAGLGGWAEGLLDAGFRVVGFDIERHDYGSGGYPGELVLQDVRTLDGRQFRDAWLIVASPPCQQYSYRAMPWKRARALPPPDNTLFEACFRIQREASEAAGREIPLVIENVQGAQKWVGSARWHYGSYFLWGDVPALMPFPQQQKFNPDGTEHGQGSWFKIADSKNRGSQKQPGRNFHFHKKYGIPSPSFHGAAHEVGVQTALVRRYGGGFGWDNSPMRMGISHSHRRKAASALIAKIPYALARWIGDVYYPKEEA